jgi:hypothetical protein
MEVGPEVVNPANQGLVSATILGRKTLEPPHLGTMIRLQRWQSTIWARNRHETGD